MDRLRQRAIQALGGPVMATFFVMSALIVIVVYQLMHVLITGEWAP